MFKEYFLSVMSVLLVSMALMTFTHGKVKRISKIAIGIVVSSVIMLPIVDILLNKELTFDLFFENDSEGNLNDEEIERAFEIGIEKYISNYCDIDPTSVCVLVDGFDMSSMRAERIYVTLKKEAMLIDYRKLEDVVEENFTNGGRCEVEFDVG